LSRPTVKNLSLKIQDGGHRHLEQVAQLSQRDRATP